MSTSEPTTPAPAPESTTAAAEAALDATIARRERGEHTPWDMVCELEDPAEDIRDFARALNIIGCDLEQPHQGAVCRLSRSIEEAIEKSEEWRGKLFHALHPLGDNKLSSDGEFEAERKRLAEAGYGGEDDDEADEAVS